MCAALLLFQPAANAGLDFVQADCLAAECQADGQRLRQDLTSCTAKLDDLEVEKNR